MPDDTDDATKSSSNGPGRRRRNRRGGDRGGSAELPLRARAHHRRRAGGRHRARGDGPRRRRPPRPAALERRADRAGAGHPRPQHGEEQAVAPADVARGGDRLGGPGGGLRAVHALRRPAGRRRAPRRAGRGHRRRAPALALRVRRHAGDPARAGFEATGEPEPLSSRGRARARTSRWRSRAVHEPEPSRRNRTTSRVESAGVPRPPCRVAAGVAAAASRLTPPAAARAQDAAPPRTTPEHGSQRPYRQREHGRGPAGATCGWPSARACCSARWRWPASPPARWPPWSSSASWSCWRPPRPTPPSAGPSTTRPRCSAWWPSCRS